MLIFGINLMPHRLRTAWKRMFRYFLESDAPACREAIRARN
jgi:hypothetical protein